MLCTPRKTPWNSTRFPSLEVSAIFQATSECRVCMFENLKPYDWCHCCCFFGRILIWASSCFKLFVHFWPSNDALSIGRSCWFWPRDGAHCRLESLLMVMTHRCLNPIVLGRVGWWVKASRRDLVRGDLVPPHWVELRRIVVHCGFPKHLYVSYEGVSFLPAISWPRTACGVAKTGIFLNHLSNWGPRFNQMSPGSRTVGNRNDCIEAAFGAFLRAKWKGTKRRRGTSHRILSGLQPKSNPVALDISALLPLASWPFWLMMIFTYFYILLGLCLKLKDGNDGFEWLPGPMCCAGSARGQPCGTWLRPMM